MRWSMGIGRVSVGPSTLVAVFGLMRFETARERCVHAEPYNVVYDDLRRRSDELRQRRSIDVFTQEVGAAPAQYVLSFR